MSDFSNSILAVTGASGHLGRLVIDDLLARGAKHLVAVTRDPKKLADLGSRVEIRAGDFDDPASLATAFASSRELHSITQTLRLFFNGRLNIAEASVDRFAVNPAKIKARSIKVAL